MPKIHPFTRNAIKDIIPYEPGKPISEVQREYGLTDVIKLASNENPLGPSPKAVDAIKAALQELNLYPDGGCYLLRKKLSEKLNVQTSQLVIGNGSAELIELICEAFIGEGDEAVIGYQAFFKYRIAVQIMNGVINWAEMPGNTYDADEILAKVSGKTKVLFIANPNNPTGTLMDKNQVAYLMDRLPDDVIVVFDEAYYDYQSGNDYPDTIEYLQRGLSVIILRTFSKSYGLAGLRIGYAITNEGIAHSMNGVREAFNVNSLAQVAATAALDDDEFLQKSIKMNEEGKLFFYKELERLGLEYRPTAANFILIKVPIPGRDLFKLLLKKGVVVRPVDGYGLPEYIRVSIGLPDENRRFFSSLEGVIQELNHC
ncbi:histidinol-phosphate transaminase [bacterium]|nr:histidinol-phosphate transaminase [bacterium]